MLISGWLGASQLLGDYAPYWLNRASKPVLTKPFATFLHYIWSSVNTGETSGSPVKNAFHSWKVIFTRERLYSLVNRNFTSEDVSSLVIQSAILHQWKLLFTGEGKSSPVKTILHWWMVRFTGELYSSLAVGRLVDWWKEVFTGEGWGSLVKRKIHRWKIIFTGEECSSLVKKGYKIMGNTF